MNDTDQSANKLRHRDRVCCRIPAHSATPRRETQDLLIACAHRVAVWTHKSLMVFVHVHASKRADGVDSVRPGRPSGMVLRVIRVRTVGRAQKSAPMPISRSSQVSQFGGKEKEGWLDHLIAREPVHYVVASS